MSRFAECFFLVFGQLAVGGMYALAVPEFREIERGFYKSSAGIFAACAVIFIGARARLILRGGGPTGAEVGELVAWSLFILATGAYLATLWSTGFARTRARTFAASLLLGASALAVSAWTYRPPERGDVAWLLYALPFGTGALMLGTVATGMLLGHWYLIDLGLSIDPLARLHRFFVRVTWTHLGAVLFVPVAAWLTSSSGAQAAAVLMGDQAAAYATRLVLGPVSTLLIARMIGRTLAIPQTMAATGLFYVAILFAMVGEMVGRLLLFSTGLAL